VTVALGTAAPLGSTTVPVTSPDVREPCPNNSVGKMSQKPRADARTIRIKLGCDFITNLLRDITFHLPTCEGSS
jgi:hypothetical protein